jgi:hypothetical protein
MASQAKNVLLLLRAVKYVLSLLRFNLALRAKLKRNILEKYHSAEG